MVEAHSYMRELIYRCDGGPPKQASWRVQLRFAPPGSPRILLRRHRDEIGFHYQDAGLWEERILE